MIKYKSLTIITPHLISNYQQGVHLLDIDSGSLARLTSSWGKPVISHTTFILAYSPDSRLFYHLIRVCGVLGNCGETLTGGVDRSEATVFMWPWSRALFYYSSLSRDRVLFHPVSRYELSDRTCLLSGPINLLMDCEVTSSLYSGSTNLTSERIVALNKNCMLVTCLWRFQAQRFK